MSDSISVKQKFPAEVAKAVAKELCAVLKPCCALNVPALAQSGGEKTLTKEENS